ncbi:MAG TPA: hypothetical protein VF794_16190 [Archangium sp.]|jgi:hypothetical protein|uniref:hypothetical protein n=1 Tax=Archangium sp. TaxID=1872627 RepID=UPI002ED84EA0
MARLEARQWGLVALVAGSPFFFAFLLAAKNPGLVEPVLGTVLGGASWLLSALLGLLGGAVFATFLGMTQGPELTASPLRRVGGLLFAAIPPMLLCIVPAVCLLLAGPALALRLEQGQPAPRESSPRTPQDIAERLRHQLPRVIPNLPRMGPW